METMTELWKDVKDCTGTFQISNLGNVRRLLSNGTYITPKMSEEDGYLYVNTGKRTYGIHQLVASAFVPGYFDGAVVNHRNENKQDNRFFNLEWVTTKYNIYYGVTKRMERKQKNKTFLKEIGKRISSLRCEKGITQRELAELCNLTPSVICNIENGVYYLELYTLSTIANVLSMKIDLVKQE